MNNTRRHMLRQLGRLGAGLGLAAVGLTAQAQSFPSRPVRILTPFPAGAGPDAALRVLAEQLSARWQQPVVVDNRTGGNGFIAVSAFRQGAADGHDLILLDSNHITTHPSTFAKLPYDVQRDFTPLAMILRTPFFITVAADSPYKTAEDLVAAARAKPGAVTYGSWFIGSPGHIGALRLEKLKDVHMTHVPYRDFGQLYAAVSTREVDWALGSAASAGPMERAGRIRFLAIAGPTRDPAYPNVPATAEIASLKGFEVSAWAGLFAPKALPPASRDKIAADIAAVMARPDIVERNRSFGYEVPPLTPTAFAELITRETNDWRPVIKSVDLRLD
ncbi:MAG: putative Bug-like extra cytoplasmic solute receptor, family [Rhodoferax sp.]|nr:putative Bug-like extra cytoplasmic solute receptor, family [Rhodoferax sp.]